eukprot:1157696-Pelagomonas_calceolata.AAC.5
MVAAAALLAVEPGSAAGAAPAGNVKENMWKVACSMYAHGCGCSLGGGQACCCCCYCYCCWSCVCRKLVSKDMMWKVACRMHAHGWSCCLAGCWSCCGCMQAPTECWSCCCIRTARHNCAVAALGDAQWAKNAIKAIVTDGFRVLMPSMSAEAEVQSRCMTKKCARTLTLTLTLTSLKGKMMQEMT